MNDQSLLSDLLVKVRDFVERQGYVKATKYLYIAGINNLCRHFERQGQTVYSRNTAWEYVLYRREEYECGRIARDTFLYTWKVFTMLDECYYKGIVTRRTSNAWGYKHLSPDYEAMLHQYIFDKQELGFTVRTLSGERSAIRLFMFFLESKSIFHIADIQRSDISEYIPVLASRNKAGISGVLSRLRAFFRYLIERNVIDEHLIHSLQLTTAVHKRVRLGFSSAEADKLLNVINRNSAVGKRDYAMMSLARYTGLRGIDVLNLQMRDIEWNSNEIRIVQHKTKRPLILPLENHVGNAIADYILRARPTSDSASVFLRTKAPYESLKQGNCSAILRRYAKKAGVTWGPTEYKGFHSFRRSIGTNMLAANVPLHTISEVLGHSRSDSTKPYLSADLVNLKLCALPLDGFECAKEELL
jgi:site-specific recombinase XerD